MTVTNEQLSQLADLAEKVEARIRQGSGDPNSSRYGSVEPSESCGGKAAAIKGITTSPAICDDAAAIEPDSDSAAIADCDSEHPLAVGVPIDPPDPLDSLQQRYKEIAALHVLGLKNVQIAERMDLHQQTISQILAKPLVRHLVKTLRDKRDESTEDIQQAIMDECPIALRVLREAMEGMMETPDGDLVPVDTKTRVSAAESFLDRAGFGKRTTAVVGTGSVLTSDELKQIRVAVGVEVAI